MRIRRMMKKIKDLRVKMKRTRRIKKEHMNLPSSHLQNLKLLKRNRRQQ